MNMTLLEALRLLTEMQNPSPASLLHRRGFVYESNIISAIVEPLTAVFALPPKQQGLVLKKALGMDDDVQSAISPTVCAAFIQEGMMRGSQAAYNRLLHAWFYGALELITAASRYADYAVTLAEQAVGQKIEFPGVYAYEVCAPFGTWFAEFVEKHHRSPSEEEARHMMEALSETFFKQAPEVKL